MLIHQDKGYASCAKNSSKIWKKTFSLNIMAQHWVEAAEVVIRCCQTSWISQLLDKCLNPSAGDLS